MTTCKNILKFLQTFYQGTFVNYEKQKKIFFDLFCKFLYGFMYGRTVQCKKSQTPLKRYVICESFLSKKMKDLETFAGP